MSKISVVVIEDHDLSRVGLCATLEQNEAIEVVGNASSARQGLRVLRATQPNVAIVDIGLPDKDGIELTQQIKHSLGNIDTKVLMLTVYKNKDSVLAAFAAGADSYSTKDTTAENLIKAIEVTSEGNSWIDPAIARVVLSQARYYDRPGKNILANGEYYQKIKAVDPEYEQVLESAPLTNRELEILQLIVAGCSNSQIAEKLIITTGTVKTHVRNILDKLCVSGRTEAAVVALRSGLVK